MHDNTHTWCSLSKMRNHEIDFCMNGCAVLRHGRGETANFQLLSKPGGLVTEEPPCIPTQTPVEVLRAGDAAYGELMRQEDLKSYVEQIKKENT